MFKSCMMLTLCLLTLLTGCMMIGYDTVADGSEPDANDDAMVTQDAALDAVSDAMDSTLPPNMDGGPDAIRSEAEVDSNLSDVVDANQDAPVDDAPMDECEPGERICDENQLLVCNADGTMELEQNCQTLSNNCETGFCNATEVKCDKRPITVSVTWCDGDELYTCDGQGLAVVSENCAKLSDECHTGRCSSALGRCITPVDEGAICSGIGQCNSLGACVCTPSDVGCNGNNRVTCNGSGQVITQQNCADQSDTCNVGYCDPDSRQCELEPITTDVFWCEENLLYTCTTGSPQLSQDCEVLSDPCNAGVCDGDSNSCTRQPLVSDTVCWGSGLCNSQGECTCEPNLSWCVDSTLVHCNENGIVETTEDCTELSTECLQGYCSTENTDAHACDTGYVDDSRVCSAGGVSYSGACDDQGRCVIANTNCIAGSDTSCNIDCSTGSDRCLLACENNGTCTATCQTGMSCDIDCSAQICNVTCEAGSSCNVNCASSTGCNVNCQEGATCDVNCAQTGGNCTVDCADQSCNTVNCQDGNPCILFCELGDTSCDFDTCSDSLDCSDVDYSVYACNTPCPLI